MRVDGDLVPIPGYPDVLLRGSGWRRLRSTS